MHFAHTRPDDSDRSRWQELGEHLQKVADLAREFAPEGLKELAATAGLWHDLGKYQTAFQRYIGVFPEASNEKLAAFRSVPHSAAGAALAFDVFGSADARAYVLAAVIEAHHGALKSLSSIADIAQSKGAPLLRAAREGGAPGTIEMQAPVFDGHISALGTRMLFSALVDADLLDTEAWDKGYGRERRGESLTVLRDRLMAACEAKIASSRAAATTEAERTLHEMRRQVYEECVLSGRSSPGVFTLTVPTGGGKTLSGLAFALEHAVFHNKQRIIVVAPYTAILEQTAHVYRDIFGGENVLEHHSNLEAAQDTDRNRQATENWDAPLIVTTSVQLFESLHACHKRPCRKLHRIANSVILLDEVQTFPTALLQPIHAVLKRLVEEFGVTVVHGTATQPLLGEGAPHTVLPRLLRMKMKEIVKEPARHFAAARDRFKMERLGDLETPVAPTELADHIARHPTVLAIAHQRRDAAELAKLLGEDCLHLSAAMCAEHRTAVLTEVRRRLKLGEPCRLVSTQLVEAGVDIDFPVVFRAMAGLETLAQAAGRCNRELRLPAPGRFVVYRAGCVKEDETVVESRPPRGTPTLGMQKALTYFEDGNPDLCDPSLFPRYTTAVLRLCETDKKGLLGLEEEANFPEVAAKFRMIDEVTISVVAPYGRAPELVAALRAAGPSRERFRVLQRFVVGMREDVFNALYGAGWLEPLMDEDKSEKAADAVWVVRGNSSAVYDERFGFAGDGVKLKPLMA